MLIYLTAEDRVMIMQKPCQDSIKELKVEIGSKTLAYFIPGTAHSLNFVDNMLITRFHQLNCYSDKSKIFDYTFQGQFHDGTCYKSLSRKHLKVSSSKSDVVATMHEQFERIFECCKL